MLRLPRQRKLRQAHSLRCGLHTLGHVQRQARVSLCDHVFWTAV